MRLGLNYCTRLAKLRYLSSFAQVLEDEMRAIVNYGVSGTADNKQKVIL